MKKLLVIGYLIFLGEYADVQKAFSTDKAVTKVFVVDKDYDADVKLFVVAKEYDCDLKVFKAHSEYVGDKVDGVWLFVDYEYKSDKTIFFVHKGYDADLKISYVDSRDAAGWCAYSQKKHLMK